MVGPTQDLQRRTTLGFGTEAEGWVPPLPALLFAAPHICTFPLVPARCRQRLVNTSVHPSALDLPSTKPFPSLFCIRRPQLFRSEEAKEDRIKTMRVLCNLIFFFCELWQQPPQQHLVQTFSSAETCGEEGKCCGCLGSRRDGARSAHLVPSLDGFFVRLLLFLKEKIYKSPIFELVVNRSWPRKETFSVLLVGLSQVTEG